MGRQRFFGNKAHGVIFISGGAAFDILDTEVIVIGNKTYEWDVAGDGVVGGNVAVDISGDTSAADAIATLVGVINGDKPQTPVTAAIHPLNADCAKIISDNRGAAGNQIFTTDMGTGTSSISGTGLMQYGENGGSQTEQRNDYTVEFEDISALGVVIDTGAQTPRFPNIEVRSSAGAPIAWDGKVVVVGTELHLDQTGAVDLSEGDVITWGSWE